MKQNLRKIATAVISSLVVCASSAHASILVDGWTFNPNGLDAYSGSQVVGIDQIQFTGIAHAQNFGVVAMGTETRAQGLLSATSFLSGGNVITGTNLNNAYELTFSFDVAGVITNVSSPNVNTTHITSGTQGETGLLNIYFDNFSSGTGVQSNQSTGNGYLDDVLLATFKVLPGDGGVFNVNTFNGSDNATFELVSALSGHLFDKNGNDLSTQVGSLLMVTASQFNAAPNNAPGFAVNCPSNGLIGGGAASTQTISNFCAQEDGRASLQQVPEPASLALMGLALAGLGVSRRKNSKA